MIEILEGLSIFTIKLFLIVIAIVVIISQIKSKKTSSNHHKQDLAVEIINQQLSDFQLTIAEKTLEKKHLKVIKTQQKKHKHDIQQKDKAYWLSFKGDMNASGKQQLKDEITAVLTMASPADMIVLSLTSGGGSVTSYGHATAQLQRVRNANIPLTVCIDEVAASGGYLMASVANKIIAAPFAMVGSIGVWIGLPNFNKWLKKNDINWEEITAGDHKRNLSLLGEVSHDNRLQAKKQATDIHEQFKNHVAYYRPNINIETISNGDVWSGTEALKQGLVDEVMSTEDYIQSLCQSRMVVKVSIQPNKTWLQKCLNNKIMSQDIFNKAIHWLRELNR